MRRSRTGRRQAAIGIGALLGLSVCAQAEVVDRWREAGTVSISSGTHRLVFTRGEPGVQVLDTTGGRFTEVMTIVPFGQGGAEATAVVSCSPRSRTSCRAQFSAGGAKISAEISIDDTGGIRIEPGAGSVGVSVRAALAHAILPSRQLDDVVYAAEDYPDTDRLSVPAENLLVGLVRGGGHVIAVTWPPGDQTASVRLTGGEGQRQIASLDVTFAGEDTVVGDLAAPGMWHAVTLSDQYEQRDVGLTWYPPFGAGWKTQLAELDVPTTFHGKIGRHRQWRPTIGFYLYPFFEEDDTIHLNLHKQLAHTGAALIYALDGAPLTPYGLLVDSLPPQDLEEIAELRAVEHYYTLDPDPTRPGLVQNAHCLGRDQLKATTFTVGAQLRELAYLNTHIDDRVHECEFIAEYHVRRCLDLMASLDARLEGWLADEAGNVEATTYLERMRGQLADMSDQYRARLKGESPDDISERAREVGERFKVVVRESPGLEGCPEAMALINELNAIISMEEDQGRKSGTLARALFQQAAYLCAGTPSAVKYAEQIRAQLREHLRLRQYESPRTSDWAESLLPE